MCIERTYIFIHRYKPSVYIYSVHPGLSLLMSRLPASTIFLHAYMLMYRHPMTFLFASRLMACHTCVCSFILDGNRLGPCTRETWDIRSNAVIRADMRIIYPTRDVAMYLKKMLGIWLNMHMRLHTSNRLGWNPTFFSFKYHWKK